MYIFAFCLVWKWSVKVAVKLWRCEHWGLVRYRPSTLSSPHPVHLLLPLLPKHPLTLTSNTNIQLIKQIIFGTSEKKTLVATASQGYSTYLLPSSFFLTEYLCVIRCSSEATDSLSTCVDPYTVHKVTISQFNLWFWPFLFWSVSFEFPNLMEVQNWKRRRTPLTQTITFSQTK